MSTLSTELLTLTLATGLTGILWVPIILNRISEMKLWPALRNPQPDVRPEADWAYRLANAHRNAIENLVVYAPLALAVHISGSGDGLTATAGWIFVFSRLAHALIYALGIPLLRTIAFFAGFLCQATLFGRLLGMV